MRGVSLSFAGQELVPTPDGALLWPARRALLVADLHFEKASWYAARGQFLPPYDSEATLAALTALAERTGARELWCLGDSFHDSAGAQRLPGTARAMLTELQRRLDWTWVVGNHDAALGTGIGGRIVAEAEVDGLLLRHEALPGETRPELSGHFHPKLRVRIRGRSIARRCFIQTPTKLILPAFGALTGGLDAADPAIRAAVGRPASALVATDDRLLRFPLAA
ncbi:MAG: ligase-associated DNA damage response endonuclease PdeM [Alphaproteobacteria bacterium]|nr:ligase-associated DNA damage response endonuclease PdeM [Alphaproteobacteria bacterium]